MLRPTHIEIHRKALQNNIQLLKKWNGADSFFCPMVKANAYGHGEVLVAKIVEEVGASAIGVALIEEGLRLREAGIQMPILAFAPINMDGVSALLTHKITPVVGRFEDLKALADISQKLKIGIHIKLNTGMNRLGFDSNEIDSLKEFLKSHPHLQVEGVCTHLTHGVEADRTDGFTSKQLAKLKTMGQGFPGVRHAHKSASLCTLIRHNLPKDPAIGTRPGISLYGIPHDNQLSGPGLEPVLRWVSQLVRIHEVEKGENVSYSARWAAPRRSVIGVLPVGYGDGYMRSLSNKGEMLYRGARVPVVGSVCMDYTLIDLTDICRDQKAQVGEEVVLLGQQGKSEISAVDLAEKAGTIGYEIVTGISHRVPRGVV